MTKDKTTAVERLSWSPTDMVQMNGHGDYVYYADYAVLAAKLTTCSGNAEKYGHRALAKLKEPKVKELLNVPTMQ